MLRWYSVCFGFQLTKYFGGQNFRRTKVFGVLQDIRHFGPQKFCPIRYVRIWHEIAQNDPKWSPNVNFVFFLPQTDGVHKDDDTHPSSSYPEASSEAVKVLKGEYVVQAIRELKMDMGIIFCRTKLDCDNMER